MKKVISVLITVALALSLIGCSLNQNSAGKSSEVIAEVEDLISSIGEVSLDSKNVIINAETAYNNLDDEQKAEVQLFSHYSAES